jgi:cobalt/nickel transport system permease protein
MPKNIGFIENTLSGITTTLNHTLTAEQYARRHGLLQGVDPRIKVISMVVVLIGISMTRQLPVLVGLYACLLFMAKISSLPLKQAFLRVWLVLPFFSGLIALPMIFNVVTRGHEIIRLLTVSQETYLSVTQEGILAAMTLMIRVACSITVTTLLILTTSWTKILHAVRMLGVPVIIIAVLGMTYRYIYVLLEVAENMFLARKSRVIGYVSVGSNRRFIGGATAHLMQRSMTLSEEVYLAMQARGYSGEIYSPIPLKTTFPDAIFLVGVVVCTVIMIFI